MGYPFLAGQRHVASKFWKKDLTGVSKTPRSQFGYKKQTNFPYLFFAEAYVNVHMHFK